MKEKFDKKKFIIVIMVVTVVVIGGILIMTDLSPKNTEPTKKNQNQNNNTYELAGDYNVDLIRKFYEMDGNSNFLISPYNIEIALNMLRDGADGKTKEEFDKLLGNRVINSVSSSNTIGVANGVFIKDTYKNDVKDDYYNILKTKYNADIKYDSFKTPKVINDWVDEKTNGMIKNVVDSVPDRFIMGIASALAIDVKWQDEFECYMTKSAEFTKVNNEKINVEMMHQSYETSNYKYIKDDDYEGIVLPYKRDDDSSVQLEFIGILPNNIDNFIKELSSEKLSNIDANSRTAGQKLHIRLSLPRFTYDFSSSDFTSVLNNLGIVDAFNPETANFKKMIETIDNAYLSTAIHKTHIELNEVGTKAAAVTYFGVDGASAMNDEYETIEVNFNKPFVYLIRESNTKEILFFGTVYEPNIWKGSTCEE